MLDLDQSLASRFSTATLKEEHNVHRVKINQVIKPDTTISDPKITVKINPLINFTGQFAITSLNTGHKTKTISKISSREG